MRSNVVVIVARRRRRVAPLPHRYPHHQLVHGERDRVRGQGREGDGQGEGAGARARDAPGWGCLGSVRRDGAGSNEA